MGRFVADIIRRDVEGLDPRDRPAFSYKDKGSMAIIARGKAVASIRDFTFGGLTGWVAWGIVHIL